MLQLQRNLPTDHAAVAEGPGGRDHAAIAEGPGGLDSSSERRGRSLVVGVCGGSQGRRGRSGYPGDRDGRRDNSPDLVEIGGQLWTTGEIRTPENSDGDFHRETPTLYVEPPPGLSLEPPPGLGPTSPWPDWVSNWESSVGRGPPPEDVTRSGTNDGTRGQENLDRHGRGDTGATYYGATYCPIWRWAKEGPDSGQDGSSRPGNTAVAEEPEIGKPSANKCRTNRTGTTQTVNTRAPGLGDPKLVHIDSLLAQGFFAKGMSPCEFALQDPVLGCAPRGMALQAHVDYLSGCAKRGLDYAHFKNLKISGRSYSQHNLALKVFRMHGPFDAELPVVPMMLRPVYHADVGIQFYVCKGGDPEKKWMWSWQEMVAQLRPDSLQQMLPHGSAIAGCKFKLHGDGIQRTGHDVGHFVVTMTNGEEWWMHPNFKNTDIAPPRLRLEAGPTGKRRHKENLQTFAE